MKKQNIKYCNTVIYVIKNHVYNILLVFVLSFLLPQCSTTKSISTNLPNYRIELEGRRNKPTILLLQDLGCQQNDSIVKNLRQQGFSVLRATTEFDDPFQALNADDLNTRVQRGVELLDELKSSYNITAVGATGMEVHTNSPWIVNSRMKSVHLFPLYKGSLKSYLVQCMSNDDLAFTFYNQPFSPDELYVTLQQYPAPSGMVNHYSYRLLESIWEQNPKNFLSMIEMEVYIQPLY